MLPRHLNTQKVSVLATKNLPIFAHSKIPIKFVFTIEIEGWNELGVSRLGVGFPSRGGGGPVASVGRGEQLYFKPVKYDCLL